MLSAQHTYVGPLRWLIDSGENLYRQISELYTQVFSEGKNINLLLRSPEFVLLWREILMNLAVASDLRSEQLVKVVKNWPESGSRNIISWWRKVIFSTQEELINTVPYIPPYEKSFRAISLFFKPLRENQRKNQFYQLIGSRKYKKSFHALLPLVLYNLY